MKKRLVQIVLSALIAAFIMPAAANAQDGKADFSGNWAFNASKSDPDRFPISKLSVKQDTGTLTDEVTMDFNGKPSVFTRRYNLDGKENIKSEGDHEYRTTVSWSSDGKTMTISTVDIYKGSSTKVGTGGGGGSTSVWTLQDPGTLVITSYTGDSPGMKSVYDRK
jgi:hypothetical protein